MVGVSNFNDWLVTPDFIKWPIGNCIGGHWRDFACLRPGCSLPRAASVSFFGFCKACLFRIIWKFIKEV